MRHIQARPHQDSAYRLRQQQAVIYVLLRELVHLDGINFRFLRGSYDPIKIRFDVPDRKLGYDVSRDIVLNYAGHLSINLVLVCQPLGWSNQNKPSHSNVITSFKDAISSCYMCDKD